MNIGCYSTFQATTMMTTRMMIAMRIGTMMAQIGTSSSTGLLGIIFVSTYKGDNK